MPRQNPAPRKRQKTLQCPDTGQFVLTFQPDIANRICERLAEGQSLREICADKDMPGLSTVFRWLARFDDFSEQYSRAREAQADALFDEILDIADDGRNDWMKRRGSKTGDGWVENGESLRRSAMRIDARKWLAGKLRPKKYGDRTQMILSGPQKEDGEPTAIQINIVDPQR